MFMPVVCLCQLGTNEILNIDALIETTLHMCVLKPLKHHIYRLFVDFHGRWGQNAQLLPLLWSERQWSQKLLCRISKRRDLIIDPKNLGGIYV